MTAKTALITGAAQRIGAAIARLLHTEGMQLLLHYRRSAGAAEALRDELNGLRPDSVALAQADLCRVEQLPGLVDQVQARFGGLDLLVNNASSFYATPIGGVDEASWDDLMGSNLKGPFFLSQAAAPLLAERQGCIINLVDIHAERPKAGFAVYSMAKAGNAMLVKALARELGPQVRVNGIAPGIILWPDQTMSPADKEALLQRTALQRAGVEQDIARTLLFLLRDAPYITGQIIAVDGGRTLQQ
ncbi:pteridine reductase [Magnetovirga frankeli]|uniref:pteridine reductase n=1 Tax=Magnetovirga frankeli TaxID=947516 RepID=UPI003D353C64